jgi:glutamate N-acetyltransferase/amino-acid N-acetyltransferase
LQEVSIHLAKSIARDGEGTTKIMEVQVKGLEDLELARRAARSMVISPLVKTAIYGEDPNWGRIWARLGMEGVPMEMMDDVDIVIQDILVLKNGQPQVFDEFELRNRLAVDEIYINIDFKKGTVVATSWGCDLTHKYVQINSAYTT